VIPNSTGGLGWVRVDTDTTNPWLQVDLIEEHAIYFIETLGRGNADLVQYTKTFKISSSLDGLQWTWYEENGVIKASPIIITELIIIWKYR
jgi:hypothetical protein